MDDLENDDLENRVQNLEGLIETIESDLSQLKAYALTKEDVKQAAREAHEEKVNEDVAAAAKRIFWTFIMALFAALGTLAAGMWGGNGSN